MGDDGIIKTDTLYDAGAKAPANGHPSPLRAKGDEQAEIGDVLRPKQQGGLLFGGRHRHIEEGGIRRDFPAATDAAPRPQPYCVCEFPSARSSTASPVIDCL